MTSFYEELRKNDSISDEKENEQSRKNVDKWIFRLILFLIGFMPLVVLANVEEVVSPLISKIDLLSSGMKGELFTHYKVLILTLVTVITGVMLLAKVLFMGGEIRKTKLNYVLGLFVLAIVVSTIASPNITIALNGQYNRSDGAISWLCYVTLMFIAMNIKYPKNIVPYVMYTMIPFVYINLYIITMNFYGKDLMQQAWVQNLVSIALPEGASISTGSQLVGTLNQWNYMSGMFAMMTVMYLAWAITSKKWSESIIGAITASAAIAVMFMSISTSGFLTVLVSMIFIIMIIFKINKKKQVIVTIAIFLSITIPAFSMLAEKNDKVWTESIGFFVDFNPYVVDEVTTALSINHIVSANDSVVEIPTVSTNALSAGTGRVYIWEKALELVSDRPLGYGADTFMYNFPHFNADARGGMYDENIIVDKPHNNYLGVLYSFGILGFITVLLIAIYLVVCLFKSILKSQYPTFIFSLAVTAYLAQSMFNDSLAGITAFSFVLMGIVIALQNNQQQEDV